MGNPRSNLEGHFSLSFLHERPSNREGPFGMALPLCLVLASYVFLPFRVLLFACKSYQNIMIAGLFSYDQPIAPQPLSCIHADLVWAKMYIEYAETRMLDLLNLRASMVA